MLLALRGTLAYMSAAKVRVSTDEVNPNSTNLPTRSPVEEHSFAAGAHARTHVISYSGQQQAEEEQNRAAGNEIQFDGGRIPSLMTYWTTTLLEYPRRVMSLSETHSLSCPSLAMPYPLRPPPRTGERSGMGVGSES